MNKKETKRYASIKKFLSKLPECFDDNELEVLWDGEIYHTITFDDDDGVVQFHADRTTQGVYDSWEMGDMTIREIKDELKCRVTVMKKIEFWK